MVQFTVTVTGEELKALEWEIADVQEWIQNAISNRARKSVDRAIEEKSVFQPKKINKAEKLQIVRDIYLPKKTPTNPSILS